MSAIGNIIGLGSLIALLTSPFLAGSAPRTNPPAKLNITDAPLSREVKTGTSFAPVIKKVAPSVVNIYTTTTLRERQTNPFFDDPFLRRFFGDDLGSNPQPRQRRSQNLGSGVIVTPDGYILTANHVVEGADEIKVALASGDKEFTAKVIGTDPPTDLAVLKITAPNSLPAIVLSDSDKLEVGDLVLAIGNPFAVGQTVTLGLVSAVQRSGFGITGYENFIQTDAAINPGNSGGALVDAEGRLVGINTAIISPSGTFNGVGFAVPVNMARFAMERLIAEGKVRRGFLGISIQPLTPALAKVFGLPDESSGVLVSGVGDDSSAQKAGVREGDVVIEVNGKRVADMRQLQLLVAQVAPGSKVSLKVLRSEARGRKPVERTLSATLDELPEDELFGARSGREPGQPNRPTEYDALDGVEVTDLDSRTRRQLNLPNNQSGALVSNIDPNSNAAEAGLRPGDVIVGIDKQPVENAEAAVELSNKATGESILLRVLSPGRGGPGSTRYLLVPNTKNK